MAYDGSQFYGWQIQVQTPTVQYCLEKALSEIAKEKVMVVGAGRTDTGVHAIGQVAHCDFPVKMTTKQIIDALYSKLPKAIKIIDIADVNEDFHARYDALTRTYHYIITKYQTPFNYNFKTYLPKYKIEIEKLQACIEYFIGEKDFTSFAKPNPEIKNYICDIKEIQINERKDDIVIKIKANRFLHNMVRRMVGAMIMVSHKTQNPNIITQWIEMKKHEQKNYFTAPPNGLYLTKIEYPIDKVSFTTYISREDWI